MSQLKSSPGAVADGDGARGLRRLRLRSFAAPMLELILGSQYPKKNRFRGEVLPTVSQPRHDLTRRRTHADLKKITFNRHL